jgi:TIR domain
MGRGKYRVFVSHGSADRWVAEQIARRLKRDCRCETFIDVFDVEKGDDIEHRVFEELPKCDELIALLTPLSVNRSWVWAEIGAARSHDVRIVPVLYGVTLADLDKDGGGKAFLGAKNCVELNNFEAYLREVSRRSKRLRT